MEDQKGPKGKQDNLLLYFTNELTLSLTSDSPSCPTGLGAFLKVIQADPQNYDQDKEQETPVSQEHLEKGMKSTRIP